MRANWPAATSSTVSFLNSNSLSIKNEFNHSSPADLLEKSRVIRQAAGERSYHIFYQMMTDEKIRGMLLYKKRVILPEMTHLTADLRTYHFVAQSELTIDGVDDKEEMRLTNVRRNNFLSI